MHLKEIEMENFKSFGRRIKVPFLEGYTSITGPNGAGKTNIADAILFVLGPKSSRVIRAGKLTDLIFNGGKERKPASYCEVSLVFENSDRVIPIESDEVSLTRLVKLSPTSEGGYNSYFYVNGRKSTLTAFDSLLAHARISADGYNIVQQGDIARIVEMSPLERRKVLDNIAGITKFDDDIAKAELKRKETEENLQRIDIILEEIKKQLHQLEKDREAALKYKDILDAMELAKARMAYKNEEMIEEQLNATRAQIAKHEVEKVKLEEMRAKLKEELKASVAKLEDLERQISERGGEEAKQVKERIDALRIERARANDGIEVSKDGIKRLRLESLNAKRELEKVEKEGRSLFAEKEEMEKRLAQTQSELSKKEQELKELEEAASKSDSKIADLQKEIAVLNKKIEEMEEQAHKLTLEEDRCKQAVDHLHLEIAQLEESRKTYDFELKDAEWQMKELKTSAKDSQRELKKLQEEYYAKRNEERELAKQSEELENAIKSLTREYNQLKAEAEAAESVRKGYTRAVLSILDARNRSVIKGVHGTVAELATVDPKYEIALNVAAGPRMQAIVVDDDAVAAEAINYLKEKRLGRAIFLPLNKMLGGHPRGKALLAAREAIGFAIDLISFDEKYRNAFWYVFGDTIVVDNLEIARRLMGGIRLVTLDGQLVEASGAMIGGEMEQSILKFGGPSKRDLEKLGEKLRRASEEADKVNGRLLMLKRDLAELEKKLKDLGGKSETSQSKVDSLETKKKEFQGKLKSIDQELLEKKGEVERAESQIATLEASIKKLQEDVAALKDEREKRKKDVLDATPRQLSQRLKRAQNERLALADEFHALKAKGETLEAQLKMNQDRKDELEKRMSDNSAHKDEFQQKVQELERRLVEIEEELRALVKVEESLGQEVKEIREMRDEAYKEKTRLENEVDKVGHRIETKDDFLLGLRTELKAYEDKLAEAEKELSSFHIEVSGELPSMDELKATISECQQKIDSLGPVNMRAIEDYEKLKARHGQLEEEFDRLEKERSNLLDLVAEINSKKKDGLIKVFHGINENFKSVFAELSEGGEAELILENQEDPLQGGLIIKARPPHKKTLRLEALSGGEKSLVSMAFIFAIQGYDPSPFYLLDEIDQNLDAVNAERVARTVKKNAESAQFIQISLRKVTLREADHIVGVTMQSSGISEVVMEVNISEVRDEEPRKEEVPA